MMTMTTSPDSRVELDPPRAEVAASPRAEAAGDGLVIAATFVAEGLEAPLAFMLKAAGLDIGVASAPYHQLFQELLSPHSALARNLSGVNVILVRLEDFLRDVAAEAVGTELLARTVDELGDASRKFCTISSVPAIFVVMAPSPSAPAGLLPSLEAATVSLSGALRAIAGASVLVESEIDPLCPAERYDWVSDRLAHIPYTDDYLAAMAIAIARRVHMLKVPTHKVLVLDCDHTIWRGVVGEDGPLGIALDAPFLALQQFAVNAQAQGVLVCLASKNVEADVIEVLERRSDMVLKAEHIVSHRINWEPKSSNLRLLARQLNLGLDSFVFIDDNPVECGQMMEALPEVVTLQLPEPEKVDEFLGNLWAFDRASVTQEDGRRTAMYRENAARDTMEAEAGDIGQFLAALELKISIAAPGDDEWPRVAQLTQRTNQFNFTTVRRNEAQVRAFAADGATVFAVHVRDRFGDYGLVGVVLANVRDGALVVDSFLLSCRVLGRGVEHSIVARLGELAVERNVSTVRLPFLRTSKNEPARAFADSILAAYRNGSGDAFEYVVPAAIAAAVKHLPGGDAEEVIEARRADAKKAAKPSPSGAGRSGRYLRLATELTTGPAVVRALRFETARARDLDAPVVLPRTPAERTLVALWEEVLGIRGIGIDDDFFALGGTSLQAARLFADLMHREDVSLPLTTIIESPTVRLLAPLVERGSAPREEGLVPLRVGGERNLFLVHDGDGETLLYRNIAQRAPSDLSVFGIQPRRLKNVPLAHSSIEAMAESYVRSVRERQPYGPYLLGGMCAGGLIAYEMASQLERAGERVERVLLLDSATPQAESRHVSAVAERASRLGRAMEKARDGRAGTSAMFAAANVAARKIVHATSYEVGRVLRGIGIRARFALLRRVLAGGGDWPAVVPSLDFRAIYDSLEERYVPKPASTVPAVLVRATSGQGGDVPYSHLYQDPTLGWGSIVRHLDVADVDGGHASMLQEPHVAGLVGVLKPYITGSVSKVGAATAGIAHV